MTASWSLLWAVLALWLVGIQDHTHQPTWTQVWTVVVVWVVFDLLLVAYKAVVYTRHPKRHRREEVVVPAESDVPDPAAK